MLTASELIKMLLDFISILPLKDRERAYHISMFLMIDHIEDDYRGKFLEHLTKAMKVYHSGSFPAWNKIVKDEAQEV